jgi:hypothetical protein
MLLSMWGSLRSAAPHAPTETSAGVPEDDAGAIRQAIGRRLLEGEARYLGTGRDLPFGHTIVAIGVARPQGAV